MARPVAADADATRRRILRAATALVAERGIEGATVRDIAKAAEVSLATVLHYYGSKDGLHRAVVDAMDDELLELRGEIATALVPGCSARDAITTLVHRAWQFARTHHMAHRIVLRTVLDEGGMPKQRIDAMMLPSLDAASAVIANVIGSDPLRARLLVQSLVQLSARYAIASDDELCAVCNTDDPATASERIANHLTDLALTLLSPINTD